MHDKPDTVKVLIQRVIGYLAIRIRSRQELVEYISKKTSDPNILEEIVKYLEIHKLIDDDGFCLSWVESRLRNGKGDILIQQEMRQKGIAPEIVKKTIESIDKEKWHKAMEIVALKYQHKLEKLTGYQKKSKLYSVLRQRGFSSIHIDAFINHRVE